MKNQRIRKLISFISSFTLLLQSFLPLVYVTPVYADDTSVIASDSAAIQNPETTPTPEITPEPTVTVTPTESITPSVSSTSSSAIAIPPQAGVAIPDNGVTSTSDDKSATFDNVSEGQTYTSKDGKATVTFSEITGPSGNLVIKEITLTPEQIAQSGAVSEVAYDITSSMADGTFKYNLTLPKPDSQNIEVKYSEDGNNFVTSGGVSTTDDSVVVSNVDHFTIFIVSATLSPTATLNNLSQVTVYPNETIKVTLKVELNKLSGWGHSEWKIGNGSWNSINTPDHLNLIYWSTDNFSENFDISAPSNVGTYDVSFNVCPLNPQNSCANITLTSGIIVKSFCGNGQLDINEKCDDGNTINGDGCSNSCIIEDNWKCNTNSPSICRVIVPPTVTIVDPSPIENSYVNGDIVGHVKATDDDGMGSYYLRFWKNAFESGTPNLMRECSLAPGGSALGNIQDVNCSLDTKTVSDGTYVFSAQFLDNDTKWGQATRTFYVDNHAPIVSIKTESGINDGSLGNNGVYSRISFKLNDPNGGLASVVFNGNTYIRTGEWNDLNWSNITKSQLIEGVNTIYAIDRAGNQSSPLNFIFDKTAPVGGQLVMKTNLFPTGIVVNNPDADGVYGITPALSITGVDVFQSLSVVVNDANLDTAKAPVSIDGVINGNMVFKGNNLWNYEDQVGTPVFTEGVHNLTATFRDNAGNSTTLTARFTTDATAPKSTISVKGDLDESKGLTGDRWYKQFTEVIPSITLGDSGSDQINYQILPGDVSCPATSYVDHVLSGTNIASLIKSESDGQYSLCYYASDIAGNSEASIHKTLLKKDGSNPVYTIKGANGLNSNGVYYSATSITASVTASDSLSGLSHIRYDLYNADENNNCTTLVHSNVLYTSEFNNSLTQSGLSDGRYCMRIWAYDNVQNKSWYDSNGNGWLKFAIDKTSPLLNSLISVTPSSPSNATNYTWSWSPVTDVLSGLKQYNWSLWKDNVQVKSGWTTSTFLPTTISSDGNYTLRVGTEDNLDNQSADKNSSVLTVDTVAPTATHTYYRNRTVVSGLVYAKDLSELTFDSTVTDKDPSSGLKYETFSIFRANVDGTFGWGNKAYCSFRQSANTYDLTGTIDTITDKKLTDCTSTLPDGEYYVMHGEYDNAARGNDTSVTQYSDSLGLHFIIDKIAPTLSSQTSFSSWYKTNVTSTFNYTDASGVISGNNPTCDITTEGSAKTCTITPNVCDAAGNCNTTTVTSNPANLDFTAPTSTIDGGTNGGTIYSSTWNGSISGTALDLTSGVKEVQLTVQKTDGQYWSGSAWQSDETSVVADGATNWTYQVGGTLNDGTYTVKSHAVDNAGNMENTYILTIILDRTIDEVALSIDPTVGDASNGWYQTQPTITLTQRDANFDRIEYQWDGEADGSWINYNNTPFKPASEGAHVLYYRAIDKANNISKVGVKNISWDQTDLSLAPQNVTANPNPTSGSTSDIKWDAATDNVGIDKYEIHWFLNGGTSSQDYTVIVGPDVREKEIDQLVEGRWTVSVRAFDTAGHSKDSAIDLYVDRTAPVAPTLTLNGTGDGTATLSWNAIADATDYIIWYGNAPGSRLYGARVGNTTTYTVRGLGAGNYYFVVKSVDAAQNKSIDSNEINTGNIAGAANIAQGTPAQGFTQQVLGANTDATPSAQPSPEVKGTSTDNNGSNWWVVITAYDSSLLWSSLRG